MITLNELKSLNAQFAAQNFVSEKNWEKNLEIVENVERNFFAWYDKSKTTPQKGDVIEFSDGYEIFSHAVVESVDEYGNMYVCENGSTHTDGKCFSTSGGAFIYIHASHFEYVGEETRMFWTWGCFGSGAGQGLYFPVTVKKFRQKDMKVKPFHDIYICKKHYKNRGTKVQIMQDLFCIALEFITIKAFKAFAEHVGLSYYKDDSGRYYTDQFLKSEYFWKIEELPNGCKPIYDFCNGSIVKCYAHKAGETITIYRPNPNAKEVYNPLEFEEARKYRNNPLGV